MDKFAPLESLTDLIKQAIEMLNDRTQYERDLIYHIAKMDSDSRAAITFAYGIIKKKNDKELASGYAPTEHTRNRRIKFEDFIKVKDCMRFLRDKIILCIVYYGGYRDLKSILQLQIPDIDFKNKTILFKENNTSYPDQLFIDLKTFIKNRKTGPVFLSKQNWIINPTTQFRAFKNAILLAELDPKLSIKEFMLSI